jgi:hypothetical protein
VKRDLRLDLENLAAIEVAYHALLFRRHREVQGKGRFWEVKRGKPGDGYMALQAIENVLEDAGLLKANERITARELQVPRKHLSRRIAQLRKWTREHYPVAE